MRSTILIRALVTALLSASPLLYAQSLRGPLNDPLLITPTSEARLDNVAIESITLIELTGDLRFYDAVELELSSPSAISEFPGAVELNLLGPVNVNESDDIATISGPELITEPLVRSGKTFYQIVLRNDARPDASPAVVQIGNVVPATTFPLAITMITRMKGLSESINNAEFVLSARAVPRDIGAVTIAYPLEDGTSYDPASARAPDFQLFLDGDEVEPASEFLVSPGLHRFRLVSDRFDNQEITVGVERGVNQLVQLPLNVAMATVTYSAPRGATVFVNGEQVAGASGDFTVPPGDHTIVVVVGDYTVTRRFSVGEKRTYSIAVTMDIAVEEIK